MNTVQPKPEDNLYIDAFDSLTELMRSRDILNIGLAFLRLGEVGEIYDVTDPALPFRLITYPSDTECELIGANLEAMMGVICKQFPFDTEQHSYTIIYVPIESPHAIAYNHSIVAGSKTEKYIVLFQNWKRNSHINPYVSLFCTLINEINCDRWGSVGISDAQKQIIQLREYQVYTATLCFMYKYYLSQSKQAVEILHKGTQEKIHELIHDINKRPHTYIHDEHKARTQILDTAGEHYREHQALELQDSVRNQDGLERQVCSLINDSLDMIGLTHLRFIMSPQGHVQVDLTHKE